MNPKKDNNRDDNDRPAQESQPDWKTSPADFRPDPSGSKAPPFQVPKPELHPELLNPQGPPTLPKMQQSHRTDRLR